MSCDHPDDDLYVHVGLPATHAAFTCPRCLKVLSIHSHRLTPLTEPVSPMEKPPRASNEQRQLMKKVILAAIAEDSWPAIDVGQVLVSIGSAMIKSTGTSETEFLDYARKTWAAQQRLPTSSNAS